MAPFGLGPGIFRKDRASGNEESGDHGVEDEEQVLGVDIMGLSLLFSAGTGGREPQGIACCHLIRRNGF
ncbi:MAG: hypothetical protein G3I09_07115 [Ferrovum sp.]|nr:hypothetical protein [Ferrovum sp.]